MSILVNNKWVGRGPVRPQFRLLIERYAKCGVLFYSETISWKIVLNDRTALNWLRKFAKAKQNAPKRRFHCHFLKCDTLSMSCCLLDLTICYKALPLCPLHGMQNPLERRIRRQDDPRECNPFCQHQGSQE